jgi:two-component system cell cycle response regulator
LLRSDSFTTLEQLRSVLGGIAGPVLLCIKREELAAVLPWLRDGDDVCFDDDPPELVERRQHLMARSAPAPRTNVDGLTGVLNRRAFVEALQGEPPAALLVINLDHFKRINDQLGHMIGDEILKLAAERVRSAVPLDALLARIAGDTFAVALDRRHDSRRVATAIRAAFHAVPVYDDANVTVSIGLVVRTRETTYDELLRHADGALYAAKARGRDRIVEHAQREREARERDGDLELDGFEEMTRVLAERVADVISWRGRRVFQGLRDQADIDALTGLFTRRYFDRRLGFEIQTAHESGAALAIGLLDVDHFGRVNKEHGWPTGDRVLADAATRIREALRDSDWAARYGGEEICIVVAGVGEVAARAALERVATAMRARPFATTQDQPLPITVSIGCAALQPDETPAQLLERASARLLEAKREGRDRVR